MAPSLRSPAGWSSAIPIRYNRRRKRPPGLRRRRRRPHRDRPRIPRRASGVWRIPSEKRALRSRLFLKSEGRAGLAERHSGQIAHPAKGPSGRHPWQPPLARNSRSPAPWGGAEREPRSPFGRLRPARAWLLRFSARSHRPRPGLMCPRLEVEAATAGCAGLIPHLHYGVWRRRLNLEAHGFPSPDKPVA